MSGGRPPWTVRSAAGLTATVAEGGALVSLAADGIELVQHQASAFEPGLVQIWLRDRDTGQTRSLLGAGSGGQVRLTASGFVVAGAGDDHLAWTVRFALHPTRTVWTWSVQVRLLTGPPRTVDLLHSHDVALAPRDALRTNEYYVSQYLDVSPLPTEIGGPALAVRQNLAHAGRHPWCAIAATAPVAGWATDALDVMGTRARAGADPAPTDDLPARRRQHEHTLVALAVRPIELAVGVPAEVGFVGVFLADHPGPTGPADHAVVGSAVRQALDAWTAQEPVGGPGPVAEPGAYQHTLGPGSLTEDAIAELWPGPWTCVERGPGGELYSFFAAEDRHVVTRAKEVAVLRPHGTILRTGQGTTPDPTALTATAWMTGSPLSFLARGHVATGAVLTTVRGYLGLHRAYGLRVFVEVDRHWHLADLPAVWSTTPDAATWVYPVAPLGTDPGGRLTVTVRASTVEHTVDLDLALTGPARRVLLALHLMGPATTQVERGQVRVTTGSAADPLVLRPWPLVTVAGDGPLHADGQDRCPDTLTLATAPTAGLRLRIGVGEPDRAASVEASDHWWPAVTALRVGGPAAVEPLAASLPWLIRDALVHHLSPRGLEQYTGGAWGTRDVCQGPLELLLALDRTPAARELVLTLLAAQSTGGTWPQAFGFLPGDSTRHLPAHGDIVHWPVLAVGRYLVATGDAGLLDTPVGWADSARTATVAEHLAAALAAGAADVLPGTHLVAYGHGDWNDSLQPADPDLAARMTSTWTVTLHHQALSVLAAGLELVGRVDQARDLRDRAAAVAADLHTYLLVDDELTGYAVFEPDHGDTPRVQRYLVHPRDGETGLQHGALQMIHALGQDLLDPEVAARHLALVRRHLTGVDGVRLFDRPPAYHGGLVRHFQRAETATFVGREIGLMYVHAHLRWCEALAHHGDAEGLWSALGQVLAPGITAAVPGALPRQANTYSSSSDAAVLDRADFAARYPDVLAGATGLEAGWRIYSSGPGVAVRLVVQSMLGLRRSGDQLVVDPVLPARLDGLTATVPLAGRLLPVRFRVGSRGHGPTRLEIGGRALAAQREPHRYRTGGLRVPLASLGRAGEQLTVVLP